MFEKSKPTSVAEAAGNEWDKINDELEIERVAMQHITVSVENAASQAEVREKLAAVKDLYENNLGLLAEVQKLEAALLEVAEGIDAGPFPAELVARFRQLPATAELVA